MKPHQDDTETMIYQLGLEARKMDELCAQANQDYHDTPALLGKSWYGVGLESNEDDQQKDQKNKSGILIRIIEAIIGFIKRVLVAILKFLTGVDLGTEEERYKRSEEIRKKKQPPDFVSGVVAKLSAENLIMIATIENDVHFTQTFKDNVELDRTIKIPRSPEDIATINKNRSLSNTIETGLSLLGRSIEKSETLSEEDRNHPLEKALQAGVSINGSENGQYLKTFANTKDTQQKYEQLLKMLENYKGGGASQQILDDVQKTAAVMSKQFAMEVRVFLTYTGLNKALIHVNDQIFAKKK